MLTMKIETKNSTIFISTDIKEVLSRILEEYRNRKKFILVDENTLEHCLPKIHGIRDLGKAEIIKIRSGEKNKSVLTLEKVWSYFVDKGADRSSLLINLGGGIIGDLGGFAASAFKRGIEFINIPTTLLSQVDASVGGKTGVNFMGFKNEIGVFNNPGYVIIDSSFIRTLDKRNILSGWAEMLKHTLISNEMDWENLISHNIRQTGFKELNQLIARSVNIKNYFVEQDPRERNIRKALNFGHTFGHAFESLFMNTSNHILHGEAVAHGIICELHLSHEKCNFPKEKAKQIITFILENYPKIEIDNSHFNKILDLINHDKKNEGDLINFTLLENFGVLKINTHCTKEDIVNTLHWYKTL